MINRYSRQNSFSEKYEARVEKFGKENVIPLWVADMDLPTSQGIEDALKNRIDHPIFGYTTFYDLYIQSIQHWMHQQHGWQVDTQEISPINSIVSALNIAVETFSKPGDGVLIQTPIYPPFMGAIKHQKRRILDNTLVYEEGQYHIDFEDFEQKAKEASLFLFCSPHNPSGRVWQKEELEKIAAICQKYDLLVLSDEVHADIVYHQKHIPIATLLPHLTITLNAPSKTFNIAGIVNAYAIIHDSRLRRKFLMLFKRYALIQANPLSLAATVGAYRQSDAWLKRLKSTLQDNLAYLNQKLDKMSLIKPVQPQATFLLWLDCRKLALDDAALHRWFSEEAGLGLNPGDSFGAAGSGFMRLNFAHPPKQLALAMHQLETAYKKLIKE